MLHSSASPSRPLGSDRWYAQDLLHVCERELFGLFRKLVKQLVWEFDVLVVGQLALPVLGVLPPLAFAGIGERAARHQGPHAAHLLHSLLAVEPGGSAGESRVETVEVVGSADLL